MAFFVFLAAPTYIVLMKYLLHTIAVLCIGVYAGAQAEEAIVSFRAEEVHGSVYLTWEIRQGYTCNGVDVLRSEDSINYTKIGDIEGICGSNSENIAYDFTDASPISNTRNYYRLSLGGIGYSAVIGITVIDLSEQGFLVVPNPVHTGSQLYFSNDTHTNCILTVLDTHGREVIRMETSESYFVLRSEELDAGVHRFRITFGQDREPLIGSFLVLP